MISKLSGNNIIDHLLAAQKMRDETFKYFHFDSPLMKAIRRDLTSTKPRLFYQQVRPTPVFANAVVYRDYHITPPPIADHFVLEINIIFYKEDEYTEEDTETERTLNLLVPTVLELGFTQEKFDSWVDSVQNKRNETQKTEDLQTLETLIAKYPEEAKKLL